MQYSQEHLKTMVYAEFGGQTECIMGNWKIENRELKQRQRRRQRARFNLVPRLSLTEPWKRGCDRSRSAKQQLCTCITLFCNFLCRRCTTYDVKMPNVTFYEDVNTRQQFSFSCPEL